MNICRDCRWHLRYRGDTMNDWCTNPQAVPQNPVNGMVRDYCEDVRKPDGTCGPDGKLFAPKTDIDKRIAAWRIIQWVYS